MIVKNEIDFNISLKKIEQMRKYPVTIDTETEGLDIWNTHKLCGVGVHLEDDTNFYYPFRHKNAEMPLFILQDGELNLPEKCLPKLLRILEKCPHSIGQNIKFDLAVLHQDGFNLKEDTVLEDTVVSSRLYFPGRRDPLDLESVSLKLLGDDKVAWKT